MHEPLINFGNVEWTEITTGAREKRVRANNSVLRIVEFSPGFVEQDWCRKPHLGYVIDGEFSIEFRDSTLRYESGDGICINGGIEEEHKAIVTSKVTLFLVEFDSD